MHILSMGFHDGHTGDDTVLCMDVMVSLTIISIATISSCKSNQRVSMKLRSQPS